MGGSSSKNNLFAQKRKSPLNKAWSHLRGALPHKKRKKSVLSLDRLSLDNLREKHSLKKKRKKKKRLSLTTDKKEPLSVKRLSLGNTRKNHWDVSLRKKKDGGLGKVGEQMKRKLSRP